MSKTTTIVTGGAGFIGSNFVNNQLCSLAEKNPSSEYLVLDALTYSGHLPNIESTISKYDNIQFFKIS